MIDGQSPNPPQPGMNSEKYRGEFTIQTAHDLTNEVRELVDQPAEDYFAVLRGAAAAQGYADMATAIEQVSKTSRDTILHGSYEPIVTSMKDGQPTSTQSAEQWAREEVAFSLGIALADLYRLGQGENSGGREQGTSTIADLGLSGDLDKELFVLFARILAREPERLDAAQSIPDAVTDKDLLNISPEEQAQGVVTHEGQPDKIVRFQKVVVDSTVPGFNFVMWRHHKAGQIRGNDTDQYKLYLERKQ